MDDKQHRLAVTGWTISEDRRWVEADVFPAVRTGPEVSRMPSERPSSRCPESAATSDCWCPTQETDTSVLSVQPSQAQERQAGSKNAHELTEGHALGSMGVGDDYRIVSCVPNAGNNVSGRHGWSH